MAGSATNLSPANALSPFGLLGLGLAIGWTLAIGFGIAALATGVREGYSHRVMAMAVLSLTFASSTLWDHYLAVLVPLILWAWPTAGRRQRTTIAVFVLLSTGLWLRLEDLPVYRLALVAALVACSFAIVGLPEWPRRERLLWAPNPSHLA